MTKPNRPILSLKKSLIKKPEVKLDPEQSEETPQRKLTAEEQRKADKETSKAVWIELKKEMKAFRKVLFENHPEAFDCFDPKPLEIGVHTKLFELYPEKSHRFIRRFLTEWVRHPRYQRALKTHNERVVVSQFNKTEKAER